MLRPSTTTTQPSRYEPSESSDLLRRRIPLCRLGSPFSLLPNSHSFLGVVEHHRGSRDRPRPRSSYRKGPRPGVHRAEQAIVSAAQGPQIEIAPKGRPSDRRPAPLGLRASDDDRPESLRSIQRDAQVGRHSAVSPPADETRPPSPGAPVVCSRRFVDPCSSRFTSDDPSANPTASRHAAANATSSSGLRAVVDRVGRGERKSRLMRAVAHHQGQRRASSARSRRGVAGGGDRELIRHDRLSFSRVLLSEVQGSAPGEESLRPLSAPTSPGRQARRPMASRSRRRPAPHRWRPRSRSRESGR